MKIYEIKSMNYHGVKKSRGFFLDIENAKIEKEKIDSYKDPHGDITIQTIVEHTTED